MLPLFDLSSAFDTVNHAILWNRLNQLVGILGSWNGSHPILLIGVLGVFGSPWVSSWQCLCHAVSHRVLFRILCCFLCYVLDRSLAVHHHFYADDIQLNCSFKPGERNQLSLLNECLDSIKIWEANNCWQLKAKEKEALITAPENLVPNITQYSSFVLMFFPVEEHC